jgi:hypothetical protein
VAPKTGSSVPISSRTHEVIPDNDIASPRLSEVEESLVNEFNLDRPETEAYHMATSSSEFTFGSATGISPRARLALLRTSVSSPRNETPLNSAVSAPDFVDLTELIRRGCAFLVPQASEYSMDTSGSDTCQPDRSSPVHLLAAASNSMTVLETGIP